MKNPLLTISIAAALATTACAQVQDVGLTMNGGLLTVIFGQDCGPVNCTPMFGGNVGASDTRSLMHFGAPATLYVIAIGLPGACVTIPGFDNPLLLQDPVVLGFGVTSAPPLIPLPCQQGVAGESFTLPNAVPAGFVFRAQSLGVSPSTGTFAFGPAIEITTV